MALPTNYIKAKVIVRTPNNMGMINVLWYTLSAAPAADLATAIAWANQIDGAVGTPMKACLPTTSNYVGVQVSLSVGGNVFVANGVGEEGPGTAVSDELPAFAAVVIQKRTAVPGKLGRGRWYVGGVPETFTNEGELTGAAETIYQTLAAAYALTLSNAGVDAFPGHFSPTADIVWPITATDVQATLGTQRRRRLRLRF